VSFLFGIVVVATLSLLVIGLVRLLHPEWWRMRAVRRALRAVPLAALGGAVVAVATRFVAGSSWRPAVWLATLAILTLFALLLSLPISGLFAGLVRLANVVQARFRRDAPANPERRRVLIHATAAVPGAMLALGAGGVVNSFADPIVRRLPVEIPGLPRSLEGLRILQLTDLHLGRFMELDDLEHALEEVERDRPDLIALTGDFSDDLSLIRPALRMILQLRPRLGVHASMGNHEYYVDPGQNPEPAWREFERGGVPILVDEGTRIRTGDATLLVAHANDPKNMGREMATFLDRSVDRALKERGVDDVVLLLSHRPDGFDAAAKRGVHLTLSGHTHGGQIGAGGRSLFESILPHWYLRGFYRKDGSTLYTSAGFGHWMPFRVGCAAEAPVFELRGATLKT